METFRNRIKSVRKAQRMNQKQLANEAGISQPALSDIETGETKMPEADTVVSIAQALKVRAEWIMTGKGPKQAEHEYLIPPGDRLLQQLIDLYGLLSDDGKHELTEFANFKVAQENPRASPSNPFPNAKKNDGALACVPSMTSRIFLLALLLAGCSEQWEGFVYPNRNNLTNHHAIGKFISLDDCRIAARRFLVNLNAVDRGDYECGLNCRNDSGLGIKICEKTER